MNTQPHPDVLDGPKKKSPIRKILTLGVILVAGFFLYSFITSHVSCVGGYPVLKGKKKTEEKKPTEAPPMPVKVYKVAKVNFRDSLPSLGNVKGFREFDLKFAVNGYIEYINFREGEKITQGDIIASLDQKEALLKLEYAKLESDKQERLYELGSVLESKMKQSQLEYQSAKAELDKTNLIAPSDGYIGSLQYDRGAFVTPQEKVATFIDMKDVYIEFGVIEKDVAKVKEGQNVEVVVETYPDQIFKGKVESLSPLVEGKTRTVKIRSKISNPDERLRPGMFGRANVLVYEKEDALVVPSSSVKKKEEQYLVYLVHPEEPSAEDIVGPEAPERTVKPSKSKKEAEANMAMPEEPKPTFGTLEIRPVEISYKTPDAFEIKEGIEEGDLVMVDVEQDLQDKAKVEITETQEGIF